MILKIFALTTIIGACLGAEHAYSSQSITRYESNHDHHEEYQPNYKYKNGGDKPEEHEIKHSVDDHPHVEHKLEHKIKHQSQQKTENLPKHNKYSEHKIEHHKYDHQKSHHHVEHQIKHEIKHKEVPKIHQQKNHQEHHENKHEEQHKKKQEENKDIIKHKVEQNEENNLKKHESHENKQEKNQEKKHEGHHKEKHEENKLEEHVVKAIVPVHIIPVAQYINKGAEVHHEPATSYQHIARHDYPAPPPKGFTDHSGPAKYNFAYEVKDTKTGDHKYQNEASDGHTVKGVYGLHESDGSIRTVEYSADKQTGFSADVKHTVKHVEEKKHHH